MVKLKAHSGPPAARRSAKETHELIFSWLLWPAHCIAPGRVRTRDDHGVAQHGGQILGQLTIGSCFSVPYRVMEHAGSLESTKEA